MNLTNEVLAELSALVITNNCASIVKQLDRKLYVRVDDALKALGGKWDRKAKAHVFADDPTGSIDAAIIAGEVTTAKDLGFFPTPPGLALELVAMAGVKPGDVVLEPSAGEGAIAAQVMLAGGVVYCIERDPARRKTLGQSLDKLLVDIALHDKKRGAVSTANYTIRVEQGNEGLSDFMDYEPEEPFDAIVMNPPFAKVGKGDHILHVIHAWKMLVPGGTLVSVMPAGIKFREDMRHCQFRDWALSHGTITSLPDDSFKESGTRVRTCVVKVTSPINGKRAK